MRSSIKIFSSELKCHFSSNSPRFISSSALSRSTVFSVLIFRMSVTPKNIGLSFTITHALGEIELSQLVNAYNASMVLSVEIPLGNCISTSTSLAVLSTTFFIFILPLSLAFRILSIRPPVVVPYGTSVMASVFLSFSTIVARTLILPPRLPS